MSYRCKNEGCCLINPQTRNLCRFCRYQKCIAAGMSRNGNVLSEWVILLGRYHCLLCKRNTPCLKKNVPPLVDACKWILIFFGRNVTDKVGNQKTLYYATSNNLSFCTTCQNGENMKITFFTQLDCATHTVHLCAVFLKEKLSSVMCLIASNICWDSKISH